MRVISRVLKSFAGKAMVVAVVLGGLLSLMPASASAAPVFRERPGVRVVVRGGFYGPRYVYGPRYYGPVFVHHRHWDARFHCWR
jgi:hypothetical protein